MINGIITAIEPQVRRAGRRSNVFVDGRYAFSLSTELVGALKVGEPMAASRTADLLWRDELGRCYDSALHFLGSRPRSEREIRDRLARHGYAGDLVDVAIGKLRDIGLVDDAAFAHYWVEQRQTHRPRGARLIRQELRQKGVDAETTAEALSEDGGDVEAEGAYQAARRKAESLRRLDERTFHQRLGAFLQRRGFDFETTRTVVSRLWSELGA
ncbi:MAG: regulatory protein RecX [Chloroflexi bacterium]|nr:regulatory protein RecX [Chloroflexota bacterium]